MTRFMKLSAMMSSGLLFGGSCLPDNYWAGVAANMTTSAINWGLDRVINDGIGWSLAFINGFLPWVGFWQQAIGRAPFLSA